MMAQFHPGEVRALLERLAGAITSGAPRETLAEIGPGAAAATTGRGAQFMKESFGPGLSMRLARVDPTGPPADGRLAVRFVMLAKSQSRPETPLMFTGVVERSADGTLKLVDLRRELPGRRGR
jgi:hypothetical protein